MNNIMDGDDNILPSVVGDDANSTAESSVSHSFYSNSLFNMVRREGISDDDFLHRLSLKNNSNGDNSSASAMVTHELIVASHRHRLQRLDDDMTHPTVYNDKEDDEIQHLLRMAKRLEIDDPGVSSDASAFSSRRLPMPKQIDPPEENGTGPGMTISQRNNRYIDARYRRMNTDENQKIHAQNSTCIDSKQQYNRRFTDPCYNHENQIEKRKPDPIETGSSRARTRTFSDEDSLIEFARRMSNSCGIEDTSSIEGPNDKECWANNSHSSGISDVGSIGGNRATKNSQSVSSQESHVYDDEEKQQTGNNSKGSKMKGLFNMISGKSNKKQGIRRPRDRSRSSRSSKRETRSSGSLSSNRSRQSSRYGVSRRTRDRSSNSRSSKRERSRSSSLSSHYSRDRRSRRSRSNSRTSRRSNSWGSNGSRCSSSSRSSNYSRQSSRRSVNSSYSASSRRSMQNRKDTSMLTVAEAVAYLNKKERFSSKKISASRMSSTVSSRSIGRKNATVSKVVSAASGLKEKIRQRVVSENY